VSAVLENALSAAVSSRAEEIVRAQKFIDQALHISREEICASARQFESLAAQVGVMLDLTAGIVTCLETDCGGSIVPMAKRLSAAARHFIGERIESLSTIANIFTNESGMLEKLAGLSREQQSMARESRALGIAASIEVARLGKAGEGFAYMAHELDDFSRMIFTGAEEVRRQTVERKTGVAQRQRALGQSLDCMRRHFKSIETEVDETIQGMELAVAGMATIPSEFSACVSAIGDRIARVVAAVQMQDISRQQIEHVRDVLKTMGELETDGERRELSADARRTAILGIQKMQMECARTSTEEWIAEIDQCLEGIMHVSSSQVATLGTKILEQEQSLAAQLERFESLERDSESDYEAIRHSLAELNTLSRLVEEYLGRSRSARDRMQLLNFNSMIEARNLGSSAAAVLEIARNISRISSAWGALTDRSGKAMAELLTASSLAEQANRADAQATIESLTQARQESHAGLALMQSAASTAVEQGARVEQALSRLHREINIADGIAQRLRVSLQLMGSAIEEIGRAAIGPLDHNAGLHGAGLDVGQLEQECAAAYTCELERQVLRAALYGEAMPTLQPAAAGNDVELF
jgi:hypothetical protein